MSELVESRMGAVTWGLWPTSRFPSPLIKPDEPISGIRLSDWLHRKGTRRDRSGQALEAQNAEFSMNYIECESAIAAPLHLVPSREEPARTFKDVLVDATVCLAPRAVAKVVGPASQCPVQPVKSIRPWIDIARHQEIADPCLEPLYTLLGRARTQMP